MTIQQTGILAEAMHLASRLGEKTREKGVSHVVKAAARWVASPVVAPYYARARKDWQFEHKGQRLPYFWHRYNMTWRNERCIEVPIVWQAIERARGKRILEVGNVMSHYFAFEHDVLDKYENAPGVINQDVVEFKPSAPYDLIISISTLEHVGWDETPRDAGKIPKALAAMSSWLAPGGQMIITFPFGYNDHLDDHLRQGTVKFPEQHYYLRTSADNRWREASWNEISTGKYGKPYPDSSCHMVIGIGAPAA